MSRGFCKPSEKEVDEFSLLVGGREGLQRFKKHIRRSTTIAVSIMTKEMGIPFYVERLEGPTERRNPGRSESLISGNADGMNLRSVAGCTGSFPTFGCD